MGELMFWLGGLCTTIGLALYDYKLGLIVGGATLATVGILLMIGGGNARTRD